MAADLKVVKMQPARSDDTVATLKEIIKQIEEGDISPVRTAVILIACEDGDVEVIPAGPSSDFMHMLAVTQLGQQIVLESILYPEPQ